MTPLSIIIFNTVINTLVDSVTQLYSQIGYSLTFICNKINLLLLTTPPSLVMDPPRASTC